MLGFSGLAVPHLPKLPVSEAEREAQRAKTIMIGAGTIMAIAAVVIVVTRNKSEEET